MWASDTADTRRPQSVIDGELVLQDLDAATIESNTLNTSADGGMVRHFRREGQKRQVKSLVQFRNIYPVAALGVGQHCFALRRERDMGRYG